MGKADFVRGQQKTLGEITDKLFTDEIRFWLAELNGEIVGSVAIVSHSESIGQLRWLILDPKARGKKIGRMLFDRAIEYCKEKEFEKVFLYTAARLDTASQMYRKLGFQLVEQETRHRTGKVL